MMGSENERRLEEEWLGNLAHQTHLIDAVLHAFELLTLIACGIISKDAHFDPSAGSGFDRLLKYRRPGMLISFHCLRHTVADADNVVRGQSRLRDIEGNRCGCGGEPLSYLHPTAPHVVENHDDPRFLRVLRNPGSTFLSSAALSVAHHFCSVARYKRSLDSEQD
jgi:hypothetical protein